MFVFGCGFSSADGVRMVREVRVEEVEVVTGNGKKPLVFVDWEFAVIVVLVVVIVSRECDLLLLLLRPRRVDPMRLESRRVYGVMVLLVSGFL